MYQVIHFTRSRNNTHQKFFRTCTFFTLTLLLVRGVGIVRCICRFGPRFWPIPEPSKRDLGYCCLRRIGNLTYSLGRTIPAVSFTVGTCKRDRRCMSSLFLFVYPMACSFPKEQVPAKRISQQCFLYFPHPLLVHSTPAARFVSVVVFVFIHCQFSTQRDIPFPEINFPETLFPMAIVKSLDKRHPMEEFVC